MSSRAFDDPLGRNFVPSLKGLPARSLDSKAVSPPGVSRRDFGKLAVLTGAAALVEAMLPPEASAAAAPGGGADALSEVERREIEAKYQAIVRKWGQRLSAPQRARIQRALEYHEQLLRPIRAHRLDNADPPASVLRFGSDDALAAYHTLHGRSSTLEGE